MRRYLLTAWDESGNALFVRVVSTLEQGLKAVLNAPLAYKVAYIEYRRKKHTIADIYRMMDKSKTHIKSREYSERWD